MLLDILVQLLLGQRDIAARGLDIGVPSISWTERKVAPDLIMWVAIVCRSVCGEASSIRAIARYL